MKSIVLSSLAGFVLLSSVACDPPASTASSASPASTGTARSTATTPTETAKPAERAAPKTLTEEDAVALTEKMADVFADNASDCDKMAVSVEKFFTDNTDAFKQIKAMDEKQTKEQKKAFEEKYKERNTALMKKMEPAVAKCATNAKVQEAMKKMPL